MDLILAAPVAVLACVIQVATLDVRDVLEVAPDHVLEVAPVAVIILVLAAAQVVVIIPVPVAVQVGAKAAVILLVRETVTDALVVEDAPTPVVIIVKMTANGLATVIVVTSALLVLDAREIALVFARIERKQRRRQNGRAIYDSDFKSKCSFI